MNISLIVALTSNGVIGRSNTIPWFLPNDMLWFKYHTLNKPVVMGRKTFESINNRPLLKRLNIVLSRRHTIVQKSWISNVFYVKTPEEALWLIGKIYSMRSEVMIIGGSEVYKVFFPRVRRLYLTYIDISICGDTFFPYYRRDEWRLIFSKLYNYTQGYCMTYNYLFEILERC